MRIPIISVLRSSLLRAMILILLLQVKLLVAQEPANNNRILNVLTYNILHGATLHNDFNLDRIADVIRSTGADIVALQEVDFKTKRAKGLDLATELGWRTGLAPLFGRAMPYDGGEYGEAILSGLTFIKSRVIPLPCSAGHEPRAALEVITLLPSGDTISIVGTHLDHTSDPADRQAQAMRINEVYANMPYPTILAGDLNAEPGSEAISIFETLWHRTDISSDPEPTYPSTNPIKKIDYVMVHPAERWVVLNTQTICDSIASDHCGYLVTLKLVKNTTH